jgi:hypothetical protein
MPGRSHNGDYFPLFPFVNQYMGTVDLDPSISRVRTAYIAYPINALSTSALISTFRCPRGEWWIFTGDFSRESAIRQLSLAISISQWICSICNLRTSWSWSAIPHSPIIEVPWLSIAPSNRRSRADSGYRGNHVFCHNNEFDLGWAFLIVKFASVTMLCRWRFADWRGNA